MDLNIPEIRQSQLHARLARGEQINASETAAEFGVSVDTLRRDIIALEQAGRARRVRGGALPVKAPEAPMLEKIACAAAPSAAMIEAARARVAGARTLLLDGGSSVLALARSLDPVPDLMVITPSPWVAIACNERAIATYMLGGRMSAAGGVNCGRESEMALGGLAAEIAVLGACGLDADFGLSADQPEEARLKRAMAEAGETVMILASGAKLAKRARYKALETDQITTLVTDASEAETAALRAAGVEVHHV